MMYCPGRLSFDLSAVDRRGQGVVPSLYDRQHGPVNAVIESATVRTELALRPAARTPAQLRADIASEWQKLPLPDAVLGAPPATRLPADPGASEQRLELLLLDPSFNLK